MTGNWGVKVANEQLGKIAESLEECTLMAVGDGSVRKNRAGQAWTLMNRETEEILISGVAHVDGIGNEQCSTRAEMFGILASLTCAEAAAKHRGITSGAIDMCIYG